jgi:UDP-N-acetylmuramate dehydrogenase
VAFEISTGKKKFFENSECKFGYRDSIFKNELKGRYFIVSVTLKLSKILKPNISYRILKEYLEKNKIELTNPQNISEAVSAIRRSKLPDPKDIGNAGSFFKNVILLEEEAKEFLSIHKDTPFFREDEFIKIPAGWLIEQCGLKGYKVGNVGVHPSQALVLVNYGGATGAEIKNLAQHIIDSVLSKFGLKLTPEVNFV